MEPIPDRIDALIRIIEADGEPQDSKLRAVSALGDLLAKHPDAAGVHCLISRLKQDADQRLVTHCISVLSRIKADDAVMAIIDVVLGSNIFLYEDPARPDFIAGDESMRLRSSAALALGKIGDNRAIIPLMSILNNKEENYRLRLACAESLGKIGDDYAVNPLIDILADEREKSVYLKESVAKALGMLGDIRAIEPLIDILESKRGIRDKFNFLKEQVIEAIAKIGRPSKKANNSLILALKDEAPSIRLAAVEALGVIGEDDSLEAVAECVFDEDDDVARAAVYAVYRLGGEPAIRELLSRENLPRFLRDELESYIP